MLKNTPVSENVFAIIPGNCEKIQDREKCWEGQTEPPSPKLNVINLWKSLT